MLMSSSTRICISTTSAGTRCGTATIGRRRSPNARYLVPEPDFRHFGPEGAAQTSAPQTEDDESVQHHVRTVFADSVSPVQEQIELWSDDHQLSDSLWLRPAPGHTPGASGGMAGRREVAVFVGDLTHCPVHRMCGRRDPCAWDEDFDCGGGDTQAGADRSPPRRAAVIPAHTRVTAARRSSRAGMHS